MSLEIHNILTILRSTASSQVAHPLSFRREQLYALRRMITENEERIARGIFEDIGKPRAEIDLTETAMALHEIKTALDNLDEWTSPEKVDRDLPNVLDGLTIRRDPLGLSLILGAWNYPIQLTLCPLVGAISAGCCALVKPSEASPRTAEILKDLVTKYLDNSAYAVVTGGVEVAKGLLERSGEFDLIFYTGGSNVGKAVMMEAAKTLTPVVLELGGKSPVIIASSGGIDAPSSISRSSNGDIRDIDTIAQRVVWGRMLNAGQSCIAPDYVLVLDEEHDAFIAAAKRAVEKFFSHVSVSNQTATESFGRIVNARHYSRVMSLLENTRGKIATGGDGDPNTFFIEPTIVGDVPLDDPLMSDEIFGPVLPVVRVSSVRSAVDIINRGNKPLALYLFTRDKSTEEFVLGGTSSGSVVVNDTMMQALANSLPFGGVGFSGTGAYHGRHSFEAFSHRKAVMSKPMGLEFANVIRYPPYEDCKINALKMVIGWPYEPAWFKMSHLVTAVTAAAITAAVVLKWKI